MKITIIETKSEKANFLKDRLGNEHEIHIISELKSEDIEKIKNSEIMLVSAWTKIDATLFEQLPGLKYIITLSTGYDHINLDDCQKFCVQVSNIPAYGERAVAEFSMGLLFALTRNIHLAYGRSKENNFFVGDLEGSDVFGKTLGIVGLGKTGKELALLAGSVGMKVVAHDLVEDEQFAAKNNVSYLSLEELVATADFITILISHTQKTHHLFDRQLFQLMKKGVKIINTARGGVVNTPDLIAALQSGLVGGAALDVLEDEKNLIANNKESQAYQWHAQLMKLNVLHTGHIAAFSKEAQDRAKQIMLENVESCIKGNPINLVQ